MNSAPIANAERRQHTRHRAMTRVSIRTEGKPSKLCKAVNLSANGVAVTTENMSLIPGMVCDLSFMIDLGTIVKIHKRIARVVFVKNGITGFAMENYGAKASK